MRSLALSILILLGMALQANAQVALIKIKAKDSTVLATVVGIDWLNLVTDADSIPLVSIRKITFEEWEVDNIQLYRVLENNRISYNFKPERFEEVAMETTSRIPCIQNYQHAVYLFEVGDFDGVVTSLTECTTLTLSKAERILVYNLLSKSNYSLREMEKAETRAKQVFRQNPEYVLAPNENPGIQSLYERVRPVVSSSLSFYGGVNLSLPNTTTSNTYEGNPAFNATTRLSPKMGFHAGLQWKYFPDFPVLPIVGLTYSQSNFVRTSESASGVFNVLQTESTESDQSVQVELGGAYIFKKQFAGMDPFVELGLYYSAVVSSEVRINTVFQGIVESSSPAFDFTENRRNSLGILLSAGGLKKVARGNLLVKLQFYKGLTPMVNRSKILENTELPFSNYYFDNDFVLNRLTLVIGYDRYFFKFK